MLNRLRTFSALFAVSISLALMTGCSADFGYRSYDPYYHDYHVYSDAEGPYYNAWVVETHRPNVEYRSLHKPQREEYWRWRHDHNDRR